MEYESKDRGSIGIFLRDSRAPPNFGKDEDTEEEEEKTVKM